MKGQLQNLIVCVVISVASGVRTHVSCNGTSTSKTFVQIFNVGISLNGKPVILKDDTSLTAVPNTTVLHISNMSGILTKDEAYLTAVLDVVCQEVESIQCVVFGLPNDAKDFVNATFRPLITFKVDPTNMSASKVPERDQYSVGDIITIRCSGDVGYNTTKWKFQIYLQEKHHLEYETGNDLVQTTVTPSRCIYRSVATLNFAVKQEGRVRVQCAIDEAPVGNVTFETIDIEAHLTFHFFLSSMFLVYVPFIVMPWLWCTCEECTAFWRNPHENFFKYVRGAVSLSDGILFVGWWLKMNEDYGQKQVFASYATFAVLEGSFIFMYALFRCFFEFLESKDSFVGPKRAQIGRVAASHGAVITPVICWLMIRIPRRLTCSRTEVIFWILASLSLFSFMYVSHLREGKHWEKEEKPILLEPPSDEAIDERQ